jgi:hypothetical protein
MRLFYNLFFLLLLFTHCRPGAGRDDHLDLMQLSVPQLQEGYR